MQAQARTPVPRPRMPQPLTTLEAKISQEEPTISHDITNISLQNRLISEAIAKLAQGDMRVLTEEEQALSSAEVDTRFCFQHHPKRGDITTSNRTGQGVAHCGTTRKALVAHRDPRCVRTSGGFLLLVTACIAARPPATRTLRSSNVPGRRRADVVFQDACVLDGDRGVVCTREEARGIVREGTATAISAPGP